MASLSEEVELEQQEPLRQDESEAAITSTAGNPDPVTGNADVLTVDQFRDKISQPGAEDSDAEVQTVEPKKQDGFGGSWRCALVLGIGLLVTIVFTIVVAITSSQAGGTESPTEGGTEWPTEGGTEWPTEGGTEWPTEGATDSKSSIYSQAAVVTDVPKCSGMGKDILVNGGSAVDAAVTAQLCIGVVNSQSSGLGGGFFMVIYQQSNKTSAFLDARESAPAAADQAFVDGLNTAASPYGINLTGVPGEVRGLWDAHQRYGKLSWRDVVTPVIELAENGYNASNHLEVTLRSLSSVKPLRDYEGFWDIYIRPDGSPKQEGDTVRPIRLANTLRALAENGSEEFYTGETARKMVEEIRSLGGIITAQDFADYRTKWSEVLTSPIGDGMTLLAPSMPSGGPVLQFIISVMQSFNLTSDDFATTSARVRTYHRFIEANKFAFGLRSHIGDADTPRVRQALAALSSMQYAREVAATIPDDAVTYTNTSYYLVTGDVTPTLGGTSHVNVLAANGDAVSSTTSVNYRFGSRIRSAATGVVYNNEMADFSRTDPTSPNYVMPGRRPLSSMCGSIVLSNDGKVKMVEGSAGSKRIITVNAWIILSTLLGNVSLSDAIDERRLHSEVNPDALANYEPDFPTEILNELSALGHTLTMIRSLSIVQAILRDDTKGILAYSDPRKGGKPAGY